MFDCTYMIKPDEKYGYIVRVREIPWLSDDGKTPNEAIANIQKDIALAIELRSSIGQKLKIKQVASAGRTKKGEGANGY